MTHIGKLKKLFVAENSHKYTELRIEHFRTHWQKENVPFEKPSRPVRNPPKYKIDSAQI